MTVPTESSGPLLPSFYAGRSLFITGGTGFLGKVLVERLLSTCPDVGEVHLLMREKRGQAPRDRLEQLKQSQAFDDIRSRCPWQLDKLRIVSGDVAQPNLGLDSSTVSQLSEVSVVFHNAATIKFWESLGTALHQNVTSVEALMDLCDQLPKLEALVHVSTAYSNAEQRHVAERVYPPPARLAALRALVHALPPHLLHQLTLKYISPKPNTYVFSKAVAESVIEQRRNRHYAVAIVRPSIVVSALRHPYPGWIEGLAGPSGVVVGSGKGMLHVFNLKSEARADLIPVDITIDTMLAVAWEIATDRLPEVKVYNACSQENPIAWGAFCKYLVQSTRKYPFDGVMYYPFILCIQNRYLYKTLELLLQTGPLYVANGIAKLCGVQLKLSLITASERLRAMNRVLAFFTTREWKFSCHNVQRLRERLSDKDRSIYNLDVRTVNWEKHVATFVKGTRKYMLHEKEESQPQARKHMDRLRYVHHMVLLMITVLLYRFIMFLMYQFLHQVAEL